MLRSLTTLATEPVDLPPLPLHSAFLLAGIIFVWWIHLKVSLVRRRRAQGTPSSAPAWQRRLADWRATGPLLLVLAIGLGVALVLTYPR